MKKKIAFTIAIVCFLTTLSFVALNKNVYSIDRDIVDTSSSIIKTLEFDINSEASIFMDPIPENINSGNCVTPTHNHHIYEPSNGSTYTLKYCLDNNILNIQ